MKPYCLKSCWLTTEAEEHFRFCLPTGKLSACPRSTDNRRHTPLQMIAWMPWAVYFCTIYIGLFVSLKMCIYISSGYAQERKLKFTHDKRQISTVMCETAIHKIWCVGYFTDGLIACKPVGISAAKSQQVILKMAFYYQRSSRFE